MQGKLKEEHNEEEPEETMTTKKQSKTKTSNVKDVIERQDQEKEDSKIKADQIASKAPKIGPYFRRTRRRQRTQISFYGQ